MIEHNYVINVEEDAKEIAKIINEFNTEVKKRKLVSALKF